MTVFAGTYTSTLFLTDPADNPVQITGMIAVPSGDGVNASNVAWTIGNSGTIQSGTASGVDITQGGSFTNGSSPQDTAAQVYGRDSGVYFGGFGYPGAIRNWGTITGYSHGVFLTGGGVIANGNATHTTALIGGYHEGVRITGAAGTVTNFGTIGASGTSGSGLTGIYLGSGGRIVNGSTGSSAALIGGYKYGAVVRAPTATISNFGTIGAGSVAADGSFTINANGVALETFGGGRIVNGDSGYIAGGVGIKARNNSTNISNFGRVVGSYSSGVEFFSAGGSLYNGLSGTISSGQMGVRITDLQPEPRPVSVQNFGSIQGGWDGVRAATNDGAIIANYGSIGGSLFSGVDLVGGGKIVNGAPIITGSAVTPAIVVPPQPTISGGQTGVHTENGAALIVNFGSISGGTGEGIRLGAGGQIINGGSGASNEIISGGTLGIYAEYGAAKITNFGTITGEQGIVVNAHNHEAITVDTGGAIIGTGGTAIKFNDGTNKLIIEPGATFSGAVIGGTGRNVLTFNETGALSLTGFSGFQSIVLSSSASNTLTLTDANFGTTITAITVRAGDSGDTIDTSAQTIWRSNLIGGSGDDTFIAGRRSTMTGNAGDDAFVFTTTGNNIVTDFVGGGTDTVGLSENAFHLGNSPSAADLFTANADGTFDNATERFAYNTSNGALLYSRQGSAGTAKLVATFNGAPTLSSTDLFFVA